MNKRIIFPLPADANGHVGVGVIIPIEDARLYLQTSAAVTDDFGALVPAQFRPETDAEFFGRLVIESLPEGTQYQVVDVEDIPSDRTFRGAWEYPA